MLVVVSFGVLVCVSVCAGADVWFERYYGLSRFVSY